MIAEFFPWSRKISLQLCQVKDILGEFGISLLRSKIKRCLHECKYREFTLKCKPLVTVKNIKARLGFARKPFKKSAQFWDKILWTDETKINPYQNYGKRKARGRKGRAHDPKHTSASVKHGEGSVMGVGMCGYQ